MCVLMCGYVRVNAGAHGSCRPHITLAAGSHLLCPAPPRFWTHFLCCGIVRGS